MDFRRIKNEKSYVHPKVLSNMLTCVHNQAMGEVFMIGSEKDVYMSISIIYIYISKYIVKDSD